MDALWATILLVGLASRFPTAVCVVQLKTAFIDRPNDPEKAIVGSNITFKWTYMVALADEGKLQLISWRIKPNAVPEDLVTVSSSGIPDTSKAPSRYQGRVKWTGDISTNVASFLLSNVSFQDQEEYGIGIRFSGVTRLTGSLYLKVLEPPRDITVTPKCQAKEVGSEVTFVCTVKGRPTPNITWVRNSEIVSNDSIKGYVISDESGSSNLTIKSVSALDTGIYRCNGTNEAGSEEATGVLTVPSCEARGGHTGTLSYLVDEGMTALLACPIFGFPQPRIKWQYPDGKFEMYDSTNILKVSVNGESLGNYTCFGCDEKEQFKFELKKLAPSTTHDPPTQPPPEDCTTEIVFIVILAILLVAAILGLIYLWRALKKCRTECQRNSDSPLQPSLAARASEGVVES